MVGTGLSDCSTVDMVGEFLIDSVAVDVVFDSIGAVWGCWFVGVVVVLVVGDIGGENLVVDILNFLFGHR